MASCAWLRDCLRRNARRPAILTIQGAPRRAEPLSRRIDGKHLFQITAPEIRWIHPATGEVLGKVPAPGPDYRGAGEMGGTPAGKKKTLPKQGQLILRCRKEGCQAALRRSMLSRRASWLFPSMIAAGVQPTASRLPRCGRLKRRKWCRSARRDSRAVVFSSTLTSSCGNRSMCWARGRH